MTIRGGRRKRGRHRELKQTEPDRSASQDPSWGDIGSHPGALRSFDARDEKETLVLEWEQRAPRRWGDGRGQGVLCTLKGVSRTHPHVPHAIASVARRRHERFMGPSDVCGAASSWGLPLGCEATQQFTQAFY